MASAKSTMASVMTPHFRVGEKRVLFPQFTIALLKSHLPPNYARFRVPLTFNKLDLRDYLFHAYKVRTVHIRSSITQGKVRQNARRHAFRDPARKYMTAQLLDPFVWPQEPWEEVGLPRSDWAGFQKREFEMQEDLDRLNPLMEYSAERAARAAVQRHAPSREHRAILAEQARRLLDGRESWVPTRAVVGTPDGGKRQAGPAR